MKLPTYHFVKQGDTLQQLAKYYYNDRGKWLTIFEANPGINPDRIVCGKRLTIPRYQGDN